VLAAHLLDSGIRLGGTSERMPSDSFSTFTLLKKFEVLRPQSADLRFELCDAASRLELIGNASAFRPAQR
jgi:hypothetical protein